VENKSLRQEIRRRDRSTEGRPVGMSRAWQDALRLAETVAPTDSTVLITGESGTGKEVVARYIHELSRRVDGPFVSINCGALPESLLESELFGHTKGSFTGAVKDKSGLFAAAETGTFFLDEIGETTPATQVKLLRVLQQREVIPVGATEAVPVDARLVAATNRDLEEEVPRGTFRGDLYYRLNVIAITLPPLRERRDDIPILAESFLRRAASIREEEPKRLAGPTLDALVAYPWPGNVRELEQAVRRILLTGRYVPDISRQGKDEDELLLEKVRAGELTAAELLARYSAMLHRRLGTYAEVAKRTGLDPRTTRKHVDDARSG
jgi:transcriptional regulator with PAS, ATPase and Fis domain